MQASRLHEAFEGFSGRKEGNRPIFSGWMVDQENRGDARVSTEPGKVYVRIDRSDSSETEGDLIKAYARIRPVPGWPVLIGTTRSRPWEYTVLEIDSEAIGGQLDGVSIVEPHAPTHMWGHSSGGDDSVFVRLWQLYDFSVWPVSGWVVQVFEGLYVDPNGTKREFVGTTELNLGPHVPVEGARYVVVSLDLFNNTLIITEGEVNLIKLSPELEAPQAPADNWELALIRLRARDSGIIHTPADFGIWDLRFTGVGPGYDTTLTPNEIYQLWLLADTDGTIGQIHKVQPDGHMALEDLGVGTRNADLSPRWHADGPLAVVDEMDGVWRVNRSMRVDNVHVYIRAPGTVGSTIIDVHSAPNTADGWTSIFSNPSDRPELTVVSGDNAVVGTPTLTQVFAAGVLLRMCVDQVATGAAGLSVNLEGVVSKDEELDHLLPSMGVA